MKIQYDKSVQPHSFNEGDMALAFDQNHEKLGAGKIESMWNGTYIVGRVLDKGTYEFIDYDGIPLGEP